MSEPQRPVTIYDVARAAGVAPSTVSRTFARPGRVNAETAARVRLTAEELGYRARPISQGRGVAATRMLAVVVSDIANPFYSSLVRGTQVAAPEAGYEIVLVDARESANRERTALTRLLPIVEGVVIGGSRMPDAALRAIAKQKPTVVLNREMRDIPSVIPDNAGAMRAAIDLLHGLGHDQVVYIAGPEASWPDGMRSRAVRDCAARAGMQTYKIGPFLPTVEGGLQAARQLLARLPSAVIVYNDLMAIGVMRGLLDAGVRIPADVSVVGCDDILTAQLVTPSLTTIAMPIRQMGITGVNNLAAIINGAKPSGGEALVMPVKLKIRRSTGPRT
jgi:LacI family transcriptional regulator